MTFVLPLTILIRERYTLSVTVICLSFRLSILREIIEFVEGLQTRSKFSRFFQRKKHEDQLRNFNLRLDDASKLFQVCYIISIALEFPRLKDAHASWALA
jgi:hypothetical protein